MGFFASLIGPAIGLVGSILGSKSSSKQLDRAQQQQALANQLNEERFQEILNEFRLRESKAEQEFNKLEGLGVSALERAGRNERSRSQQSLVSRGLANTSRLESGREGIDARVREAIERLKAQQSLNRINVLGGFKGEQLAFQERKVVQGPSQAQIGLLQQQRLSSSNDLIGSIGDLGLAFGKTFSSRIRERTPELFNL